MPDERFPEWGLSKDENLYTLYKSSIFEPGWAGFLRGNLFIGLQMVSNCITRIDVANLRRANLNGVVHVNGVNRRFIAQIGAGGTLLMHNDVPPPARFR